MNKYIHRLITQLKRNPSSLIFIGIFLLAIFFRIYNIPNRYGFDGDAIRDANVAYFGATHFKFPLVGPFSSSGPFTFGPLYYYLLIIATMIFPFFYTPWFVMLIISLLTIYVFYKIGETLDSKWLGYILSLFIAITPSEISVGTGLSNLNPVPFFASLSVLFFLLLLKKKEKSYWKALWFGLALGVGMNMHFQSAGLLILPFLLLIYKGIKYLKNIAITAIGFIISFIPLFYFNLINHWHTIQGIIFTYRYIRPTIYVANSWKIYLASFWPGFMADSLGIPISLAILVIFCILGYVGYFLYKRKLSTPQVLLLIALFVNFIYLRYYWGERHFTYFLYLQPFIIILAGITAYTAMQLKYIKYGACVLFIICLLFALAKDIPMLQSDYRHLSYVNQAKYLEDKYPNKSFILYQCKSNHSVEQVFTMSYILGREGLLSADGYRLGFIGGKNRCEFPIPPNLPMPLATLSASILVGKFFPPLNSEIQVIDLNIATSGAIKSLGWRSITPELIYTQTVDWWKK